MKRILDIFVSLTSLILLSPIVLLICILVRLKLGSPIFFRQERPGKSGAIFKMVKFRTMTNQTDEHGNLLPDSKRLPPFGKWLRATSLDELPELWNVLKGDMSLVGPRPLLVSYLKRYTPEQARRHDVQPGLTGWAQVNGRNATSWEERFKMDVWYVNNRSLSLDLRILVKTVTIVFKREGISHDQHATMPEFGINEETDK